MNKIDFVLIWVDGNDPEWRKEYSKYAPTTKGDTSEIRFRDWENLRYWFRGVEKFAPWVNKVHFVTCGHVPDWLNLNAPKLNFVKHSDYIPEEYLPTFNSHTIELNLHRIKGLAEHFVYFNDDTFLINNISEDYYFKDGKPCDIAALNAITSGIVHILLNNTQCINRHFVKNDVIRKSFFKWFNIKYGSYLFRTLALMPWKPFVGFVNPHLPNAFLKPTFEEVWKKEPELLDMTCRSRFREDNNVNQYLMRYWQLVTSNFSAENVCKKAYYFSLGDSSIEDIISSIECQKRNVIVLNDGTVTDFEYTKEALNAAFEKILPEKSSFEK